jgi:hypothetical protein
MSVTFRKCEWKNCGSEFQATRKDRRYCSKSCQTQGSRIEDEAEDLGFTVEQFLAHKKALLNETKEKRARKTKTINRFSLENRDWITDRTGKLQYAPQMNYTAANLPSLDEHLRKDPTHRQNLEASRP